MLKERSGLKKYPQWNASVTFPIETVILSNLKIESFKLHEEMENEEKIYG